MADVAIVYAAYRMDTEPEFANKIESWFPGISKTLMNPIQSILRGAGYLGPANDMSSISSTNRQKIFKMPQVSKDKSGDDGPPEATPSRTTTTAEIDADAADETSAVFTSTRRPRRTGRIS